ncbi:hypothetical protein G6F50_016094 [Rhizopus delemar]|uniref:Uncharacterized protein n=1 Tax=Rhizopus delemar TaxID=936053 RepID=A0A9P6XUR9_9FUNG|nr:hypothetical protein G6F50_016094 [Rhizopus delemar]
MVPGHHVAGGVRAGRADGRVDEEARPHAERRTGTRAAQFGGQRQLVGPVRAGAGDDRVRHPVPQRNPGRVADHRPDVPGAAAGHRHAYRRFRAGHHGHSVHLLGDARSVPDRADPPEGVGLRAGLHQVGSELGHRAALHPLGGDRRHLPWPRPRPG